jgi:molybdopterin converting factor small subunit
MEKTEVDLNGSEIAAIRSVLKTNTEILGELEEKLPDERSGANLELENNHIAVLVNALEAYQELDYDEFEEKGAGKNVIRDVIDSIQEG